MIKYIMLLVTPFLASSYAGVHDATFYSLHPVQLELALEKCPSTHPDGVTCEQLDQYATRANRLVSELHYNPQLFGQKILALQEDLAKIKQELKNKTAANDLQAAFDENEMQLRERLAIVKWLESPRG